jgi:hypothetical protein
MKNSYTTLRVTKPTHRRLTKAAKKSIPKTSTRQLAEGILVAGLDLRENAEARK